MTGLSFCLHVTVLLHSVRLMVLIDHGTVLRCCWLQVLIGSQWIHSIIVLWCCWFVTLSALGLKRVIDICLYWYVGLTWPYWLMVLLACGFICLCCFSFMMLFDFLCSWQIIGLWCSMICGLLLSHNVVGRGLSGWVVIVPDY